MLFFRIFFDILFILAAVYSVFLILIFIGLCRLREGSSAGSPRVSVIVAARDEEKNIGRCLQALAAQRYPKDRYEVLVVDDNSRDGTAGVVSRFVNDCGNVRLVRAKEKSFVSSPKKNAILCGIQESTGEVILTTDADCIPPPGWISGMVRCFEPRVGAVAGFSPSLVGNSLRQRLIELESVCFAVVSAGAIGIGGAISCVGRNFGYLRKAFEEVGGFGATGEVVSGDDDLLLQRIGRQGLWELRFSICPDTFVPTLPATGWGEFINKRKRHFSAGFSYSPVLRVLGALVYSYYLFILLSLPVSLVYGKFWIWLLCLGTKLLLDTPVVLKGLTLFQRQRLLRILPLAELLHIPYLLVVWPLAIWGGFQWKERAYR